MVPDKLNKYVSTLFKILSPAALLSSVSHDLRTPLTTIKAVASSLLQEDVEWDEETRRSFARSIEREADRLNRLVGNLLDMSRIDATLNNFFRESNLTALRELALRRTAEKTEAQLQEYMTEHGITEMRPATERVLVGFDHRPHTRQVIRDACSVRRFS